jgi:hypothetical protein
LQAAQRLQLTARQVQRLVNRFSSEGAAGLVSRKRNRPASPLMRLPIGGTDMAAGATGMRTDY